MLSGQTADAGGTVTYAVYTDSACTSLAAGLQPSPATVTVMNGVVPDSADVTFPAAGTFFWQAVYSGDTGNLGSTSPCNEQLTVNAGQATTSIATTLSSSSITAGGSAHDSAMLSGQTADAGGTVTYTVYTDNTCMTRASVQPSPATVTVMNGIVPDSGDATFPDAGTFFWRAVYSGDTGNLGSTSACNEQLTVTPAQAAPTIATTLSATSINTGGSVHDSATLSGATATAGGTVTYTIYTDNTCMTQATVQPTPATVMVTNGTVPNSADVTFPTAGTFFWQAAYSGDAGNTAAMSNCASEQLTVANGNMASPTISTQLSRSTIKAGQSVRDNATLTGATATAGGTVTYTAYTDSACTTGARDAGTVTIKNGKAPHSNSLEFDQVGTFFWQAAYSGDAANNPAKSPCTSEQLTVVKATPVLLTFLSSNLLKPGGSAHDSALLLDDAPGAGGTVTYTVYTDPSCSMGARDAGTVTVTNGSVPNSQTLAFPTAGLFFWQATYSGDANNGAATSPCFSEPILVRAAPGWREGHSKHLFGWSRRGRHGWGSGWGWED
jgi:hypothetical protein